MSTAEEHQERNEFAGAVLALAGIPVPAAELGKLSAMHLSAEDARNQLRSAQLGETEPMIVFSSGMAHCDERR